jgi:formylglycine-generating enzyme required for sulfatase activity
MRQYINIPPNESGVPLLVPGQYHADTSKVVQVLKKGHHGVKPDAELLDRLATWMDLGAPSFASWKEARMRVPEDLHERKLQMRQRYAGIAEDYDALPELPAEPIEPLVPKPEPAPAAVTCPGWPFDAAEACARQKAAGAAAKRTLVLGKALGRTVELEMVLVPAGEFVMGDPAGAGDERPPARVPIERPFWMSRCEISNEQFGRFLGGEGRVLGPGNWPAVNVTWDEAMAFCRWVSEGTGETCLLPTEAQWEWACRAGSLTAPPVDAKAFGRNARPAPCGASEANAWGLCDMQGNAAEWTLSLYRPYPYADADGRNDPSVAGLRVIRGGSLRDRPKDAGPAFRWRHPSWQRQPDIGFRVAAEAKER